jgi:hypothetical protein
MNGDRLTQDYREVIREGDWMAAKHTCPHICSSYYCDILPSFMGVALPLLPFDMQVDTPNLYQWKMNPSAYRSKDDLIYSNTDDRLKVSNIATRRLVLQAVTVEMGDDLRDLRHCMARLCYRNPWRLQGQIQSNSLLKDTLNIYNEHCMYAIMDTVQSTIH